MPDGPDAGGGDVDDGADDRGDAGARSEPLRIGPFRLFWSIVLPMSKPILGVVSVFAIIAAWKDYLWPMLVLPDPAVQPLSVRLPAVQSQTELDVFLAALAIATLIPIAMFLLFQSVFLRSAGLGGAVKG